MQHRNSSATVRERGYRQIGIVLMTAALAVSVSGLQAEVQWPPAPAVEQRVETTIRVIDKLKALVPAPVVDMDDRAFALDFDVDAAIRYVAEDVAYAPYTGVLRGPEGTAMVGRGNAWDQALLLGALIRSIGGDAQIVIGALPDEDADRLLARTFEPGPVGGSDAPDHDAVAEALAELDPALATGYRQRIEAATDTASAQALEQATDTLTRELLALLDGREAAFARQQDAEALRRRIAQDYAWVRWRMGPGDEWVDVHPAFGTQAAPATEPARYVDGEVPEELLHQVSLQLYIERGYENDDAAPERVAVMTAWKRPTANLHEQQVYLGMAPQQLDASPASSFLVPVLNGGPAPGSQAVSRTGLTAPSGDTASMAGAFFATVSERGNAAAGALGALGGSEPARQKKLLGVVLQVELSSPDGRQLIERRVADLRGASDDDFPVSGMFQMVLDVDVGPKSAAMVYHDLLEYQEPFVRAVPPMMALARDAVSVQEMEASRAYRNLGTPRWLDYELASAALLPAPSEREARFRSGPMLASRRTYSTPDGQLRTVTDILANPSTSLARSEDGVITIDREGSIAQGVRETLLESELAGVEGGWSERRPATLVERPAALAGERFAGWPEQALEVARDDLRAGYLLAVVDDAPNHWWRVDPATGETLGMSAEGGSEITEYLIATAGIAISVALFANSVETCDEQYADNQAMADCCIVGNLIATYGTASAAAVGAAATTSGNALYAASGSIHSALGWNAADIGTGLGIGATGIIDGYCAWHTSD